MFQFPKYIKVRAQGDRSVDFQIMEVCHNVFAIQQHLHALKNEDDLIFGYIVFKDGYLYAYCATMDQLPQHKLIFMSYMGPEDEITDADNELIQQAFHAVAMAIVQFSIYENKHPAIIDKETFGEIYQSLRNAVDGSSAETVTPFIQPMRDLANELEKFYASMIENLDRLQERIDKDSSHE